MPVCPLLPMAWLVPLLGNCESHPAFLVAILLVCGPPQGLKNEKTYVLKRRRKSELPLFLPLK